MRSTDTNSGKKDTNDENLLGVILPIAILRSLCASVEGGEALLDAVLPGPHVGAEGTGLILAIAMS